MERFWEKVNKTDGCWEWTAASVRGYGVFRLQGTRKNTPAHRFAYELVKGPIPVGLQLDHLCRNPSCVRPDHLEPVTQAENARRGVRAMQTHCHNGHPYDEANTYRGQDNRGRWHRRCRACHTEQERARRHRV